MTSAIYHGWVRHRRMQPKAHELRYRVFMLLLDLAELDTVFAGTRWWSASRWAPAQFRREDFLGDPALPLDKSVREKVREATGCYPHGPIRMLANLRYFGYIMNPISCYYCFDDREQLQFIVAEVNNTPWNERHAYVLRCEPGRRRQRIAFDKQLHVSPFNPMAMRYHWRSNVPGQTLAIHLENWTETAGDAERVFDATLLLQRETMTAAALDRLIWTYPLMTIKVIAAIYWEALRLLLKRVPVYSHPKHTGGERRQPLHQQPQNATGKPISGEN